MRAGILILFLIVGITTGLAVSAADDPGTTQGKRAAPTDAAKEPAPPPSVTVIGAKDAHGILGREVRSAADENMGRIVDVIVDREGMVRAAVIDFGGFLGVGSRKIAVDWSILRFGPGEKPDRVVVDLTRAQVKAAPEYKDGKPVVVLGASAEMPPAEPGPASPR